MTIETELKLTAPARTLQKLPRVPWLRDMAAAHAKREKLVSVYFDTPDCKLARNHVALRIRRQAGKRIQTIKTENGGGHALSRGEWEQPVAGSRPDLRSIKGTPLDGLLKNGSKVEPIFETNIERTTIPLRAGRSEIELALDRGFVRAGRRRESIHEVELELRHGEPRDLALLAERIAATVQIGYGAQTKAERGYALSAGRSGEAARAGDIRLDPAQSVAGAFTKIGLACLHHLARNESAVRKGDAEGVHQMRVGLRRLRAALSVFKDPAEDEKREAIKGELKWLTGQLGPARDFEVLAEAAKLALQGARSGRHDSELLESEVKARRDEGLAQAKAAVESERCRRALLNAALWLIAGPWSRREDPFAVSALQARIDAFAPEVLRKRWKKIVKRSRKAEKLDAHGRHKLRIAVKKLRYATEFFESIFTGKRQKKARKTFEDLLKALQDALGKLNDIATHDRIAGQMVQLGKCTKKHLQMAYAMGLLSGSEHRLAATCIAKARKSGKKLGGAKPFWF